MTLLPNSHAFSRWGAPGAGIGELAKEGDCSRVAGRNHRFQQFSFAAQIPMELRPPRMWQCWQDAYICQRRVADRVQDANALMLVSVPQTSALELFCANQCG